MYTVAILLHVLACIGLIMIVLLQRGKGADLGAAFGGSSQTVFGSRGAGGFLTKLTTIVAVLFMFTCLGLAYISAHRVQATVMGGVEPMQPAEEPAVPDRSPFDAESPVQ
jgi:preprotein translocase subunit SecG